MIARAMDKASEFERGVELFNSGKFFEAHEAWEEIWLTESEPDKTFLQGMIQVAAAFHHHGRGNERGMQSLLAAGLAKLDGISGGRWGICAATLCEDARGWLEREGRPGRLPRIRRVK
jgi:uncharacterized protein